MQDSLTILGLMSGTSLDGVDLALCRISEGGKKYRILRAETIRYSKEWKAKLKEAEQRSGELLAEHDREYGAYLGALCRDFLKGEKADYIASHGHTIFHDPANGYTFQSGSGIEIANITGIITVNDFRSTDVSLGGQGAPLVPVGDALLFSQYTYCLNLGGFINVSYDNNGTRRAYDIVPMNYVLNRLAQRMGMEYDSGGRVASKGRYVAALGEQLDALPYFAKAAPKSLGREWVEANVFPLLSEQHSPADLLHTYCKHAAKQTAAACVHQGKMLVTGGGAYNQFFIAELRKLCKAEIVIPDARTIEFKEALIFALLGYLRLHDKVNALSSVTGASRDSSGGTIHHPALNA
jgi:anhydro-N-acetylmuramic acid kinase